VAVRRHLNDPYAAQEVNEGFISMMFVHTDNPIYDGTGMRIMEIPILSAKVLEGLKGSREIGNLKEQ
jgi:hypothetical protein